MNDKEIKRIIMDSRNEKQTAKRSELTHKKTECIKATNGNAKEVKNVKHRLDVYGEYKSIKPLLVKYEGLEGKAKEKFYEKNAEVIEQAMTYRIGLKNMGGGKITPKEWKSQQDKKQEQSQQKRKNEQSL